MESTVSVSGLSPGTAWTARVVGGLVVLFLLVDTVGHLVEPAPVVEAFNRLGLAANLGLGLGLLKLALITLYVLPRTSLLGAVLLTGYLGGAVAINLRAGSPPFETLFPVLFGLLVWTPLYLRDARLRALFPLG